jgi:glycosyltransferase involved in cell wall biosynthesis
VVDNCSTDNTAAIAMAKGATVYTVPLKGYGHALKYGMEKATGDIFVLTEADGSFRARDLGKILEYLKDADMVIGTRTTKQLIEQGANMNFMLRLGNLMVAKLIEILWWKSNEPRLTDVGCTYRGIWKDAFIQIRDNLVSHGPEFSPEMIIEPIKNHMRIIEIPVSYHGRLGGNSKHSGSFRSVAMTALKMIKLILVKRKNG